MKSKQEQFAVPRSVYDRFCEFRRLFHYGEKEQRFIAQLLIDTVHQIKRKGSLYIPRSGQRLRGFDWKPLTEGRQPLLNEKAYDRKGGLSREFQLAGGFIEGFIKALEDAYLDGNTEYDLVDLITGKSVTRRKRNQTKDSHDVTEPKHICKALGNIAPRRFNRTAAIDYLKSKREQLQKLEGSSVYLRELRRYHNDLLCFLVAENQKPVQVSDGLYEYKAAYQVQSTGRIGEIGGGLQNATRKMKAAIYNSVPDLHNYDLKSSQVNGLIQQFEQAGISTQWLVDYRDDSTLKAAYAKKIGIDTDTWKDCLMALIMGSSNRVEGSVHERLVQWCKENDCDSGDAESMLDRFNDITGSLQSCLKKWRRYLRNAYLETKAGYRYAGKQYVRNPTGKKLSIDELKRNTAGKISAFVLQGQEAAFIHELTVLSAIYGYSVIGNEHDGLITLGEIPQEAIDEASKRSGLRNPILVDKSFDD